MKMGRSMMEALKNRDWKAFGLFIAMVVLNCAYARANHAGDSMAATAMVPVSASAEHCGHVAVVTASAKSL